MSLLIGLLGGIASGKSTVAALLAEQGAVVLDADRAAHDALAEPEVLAALRNRWGDSLFDDAGGLIRRQVAALVFGPSDSAATNRAFLEQLIHPRVRQNLEKELAELQQGGRRVIILDIPLLIEAGWADDCDLLIFVDSPQSDRLARAAARGWDAEELAWREAAQLPIEEKKARAQIVLANVGSEDELRAQVERHWQDVIAPRLGD
ncbi:MAG: dephospho-CoA kinase [Planctomycetota bacterium]